MAGNIGHRGWREHWTGCSRLRSGRDYWTWLLAVKVRQEALDVAARFGQEKRREEKRRRKRRKRNKKNKRKKRKKKIKFR